ncbi:MAG: head GIN domain-containing protein [Planctomycetota bacterium]
MRHYLLCGILGIALCSGCENLSPAVLGSGVSKTETRTVADFDEIELRGMGKVEASIGALSPLIATGDDNILPLLQTKVDGRRLIVSTDKLVKPKVDLVIHVTVPNVKIVESNGMTSVALKGIANDSLAITSNGMGDVSAEGQTRKLSLKLRGMGDMQAEKLVAQAAEVEVSGQSSATVHAVNSLKVDIRGMGTVRYKGDPKIDSSVSGMGKVERLQ